MKNNIIKRYIVQIQNDRLVGQKIPLNKLIISFGKTNATIQLINLKRNYHPFDIIFKNSTDEFGYFLNHTKTLLLNGFPFYQNIQINPYDIFSYQNYTFLYYTNILSRDWRKFNQINQNYLKYSINSNKLNYLQHPKRINLNKIIQRKKIYKEKNEILKDLKKKKF